MAREFIANTGISTVQMLWNEGIEVWRHFGVASQPAWALLDADGRLLEGRFGVVDEVRVLEYLASL